MNILRIDSVGGASGDMLLAALADLGADLDAIAQTLAGMLPDAFQIECREVTLNGIRGRRVEVSTDDAQTHAHAHEHLHAHSRGHGHPHGHHHEDGGDHHHPHGEQPTDASTGSKAHSAHRGLTEIRAMLAAGVLPETVSKAALDAFQRLAEAEARVHGTTPEAVHFHEVGAVDAIVDIVGACLALEQLSIGAVQVGPLPLGSGCLRCDHGIMPTPAPATVELLAGHPVLPTDERTELVTPTGAALLMSWKAGATIPPGPLRIRRAGYGFGSRTLAGRPNLLRATLLEPAPGPRSEAFSPDAASLTALDSVELLHVIETNLDDCPAEWLGALFASLPQEGALEIWTTPVGMKKNRPGVIVSVLCRPADTEALIRRMFRETPTLGLRIRAVGRLALERGAEHVETPYGPVCVKLGLLDGEIVTRSPEFADCEQRGREHGVAPRAVHAAALQARIPDRKAAHGCG